MNLSNIAPGQRLRCRNGHVVTAVGPYSVNLYEVTPHPAGGSFWVYAENGGYCAASVHPLDIVGVEDPVASDLEAAQAAYDALGERLKALRAAQEKAAVPPPAKWSPPAGRFAVLSGRDGVRFRSAQYSSPRGCWVDSGSAYPTDDTARFVAEQLNFFLRLHALACDVNGGKFGSGAFVIYDTCGKKWTAFPSAKAEHFVGLNRIFVDLEAAEKAASIMNRDNWVLPPGIQSFTT